MKNIDKINPFKTTIQKTDFGTLTTLVAEVEISTKESISIDGKTLMANYVYKEDGTYNLVFTIIDINGITESYIEAEGILPTLFLSPNQKNFVSIVPYHPDKELEISIPVFDRENTVLPKGNRPFVGDFIGVSNQFSIFYNADIWSETKPDKMLAIEFKDDVVKKKHIIKIPLPRNNKVFIENDEIHLLSKNEDIWLHRQIDEKGNEIRQRKLETNKTFFRQILSLSFTKNSYLLTQEKGKIIIEKIDKNGKSLSIELIDITDAFYNTWQPIKIAEDTYITQFNGEFGNGWFTIKNDQLLEIFYGKELKGYKNLLTNEVLEMGDENLIISSINKTKDNSYAIVFYLNVNKQIKNKKLIILNRDLK